MKLITTPSLQVEQIPIVSRKFNWRKLRFETQQAFQAGATTWNNIRVQLKGQDSYSAGFKFDHVKIDNFEFDGLVLLYWDGDDAKSGEQVWQCAFDHCRVTA